mgnify:CR=1 FL=1
MTEESAAARLERYREAWQQAPGVRDLETAFPDVGRMEQVWAWSDYVAKACLRDPQLLADLHAEGLLDRRREQGEMADALAAMLRDADEEVLLESALRRFRRRRGVVVDLSCLARLALGYLSLYDRYRFVRGYLGPGADPVQVKRLFRQVQAHLERRPPRPLQLPASDR